MKLPSRGTVPQSGRDRESWDQISPKVIKKRRIAFPATTHQTHMAGRILVIRGGAIGDFILTLPTLHLLRDTFPQAHIEILGYRHIIALAEDRFYANASRHIEYAGMAGFFSRAGNLDPALTNYFSSFDQVISYLFDPDQIFEENLTRCGVRNIISGTSKINEQKHATLQLAQPLEKLALFLENTQAKIYPKPEDTQAILPLLPKTPFAVLHPGSGGNQKIWPIENWLALLKKKPSPYPYLIVGGEADKDLLEKINQAKLQNTKILPPLPLPQLGALLTRAHHYLGHDTGISHLAAAAGTPSLLLFGPTNPAIWAPTAPFVKILKSPTNNINDLPLSVVYERVEKFVSLQC
ncbi:MAG: glycosyltransferase family 9 protein [Chthoniobacterales bacterium]